MHKITIIREDDNQCTRETFHVDYEANNAKQLFNLIQALMWLFSQALFTKNKED